MQITLIQHETLSTNVDAHARAVAANDGRAEVRAVNVLFDTLIDILGYDYVDQHVSCVVETACELVCRANVVDELAEVA